MTHISAYTSCRRLNNVEYQIFVQPFLNQDISFAWMQAFWQDLKPVTTK